MLLLSNRLKFCSLAFTAARLYSNGPATANKNPTVFFDIATENEHLGRVTFEVSGDSAWSLSHTLILIFDVFVVPALSFLLRHSVPQLVLLFTLIALIYIFTAQR